MILSKVGQNAISSSKRAASSFVALYSTVTGLNALRNWGVSGLSPISLVSDAKDTPPPQRTRADKSAPTPSGSKPGAKRNAVRPPTPSQYKVHREKMKEQYPEGWSPPRKISRQAMDGIRLMNAQYPEMFTTPVLAEKFKISPEAVRCILRSKWEPTKEQRARLLQKEIRQRQEFIQERKKEEVKTQLEVQRQRDVVRRRKEDKLSLT